MTLPLLKIQKPRLQDISPGAPPVRFISLLGVKVALLDRHGLIDLVQDLLVSRTKGWISYVNIHTVNEACREPWLKEHINESLFTYCDGMGVLIGARIIGKRIPERITLADCIDELFATLEQLETRVFFLGASDETISKAREAVESRFPRLTVCGSTHGFFDLSNGIDAQRQINKAKPDIVFVGMGMPRQEAWIRKNMQHLNANVFWSAGALFEFLAGTRQRCPQWMSRAGLEWLFRLAQEPRRLWKRYVVGNPVFFFRILKDRFATTGRVSPNVP